MDGEVLHEGTLMLRYGLSLSLYVYLYVHKSLSLSLICLYSLEYYCTLTDVGLFRIYKNENDAQRKKNALKQVQITRVKVELYERDLYLYVYILISIFIGMDGGNDVC